MQFRRSWLYVCMPSLPAFALASLSALAVDCAKLPTDCQGWGAANPLIPGQCCVTSTQQTGRDCTGQEFKSGTLHSTWGCGKLCVIDNGECTDQCDPPGGCGGMLIEPGCTSVQCPSGG